MGSSEDGDLRDLEAGSKARAGTGGKSGLKCRDSKEIGD